MSNFKCKACGEPNSFDPPGKATDGLHLLGEQCVRCRSWNLAVCQFPGGAVQSKIELFSPDEPPAWKDGSAAVCAGCRGIVPLAEGKFSGTCPKCAS